jgi:hypothetical protein
VRIAAMGRSGSEPNARLLGRKERLFGMTSKRQVLLSFVLLPLLFTIESLSTILTKKRVPSGQWGRAKS